MRKRRNSVVSLILALVVLPEPATTAVAVLLACGWYFVQRKRSRSLTFNGANLEVV